MIPNLAITVQTCLKHLLLYRERAPMRLSHLFDSVQTITRIQAGPGVLQINFNNFKKQNPCLREDIHKIGRIVVFGILVRLPSPRFDRMFSEHAKIIELSKQQRRCAHECFVHRACSHGADIEPGEISIKDPRAGLVGQLCGDFLKDLHVKKSEFEILREKNSARRPIFILPFFLWRQDLPSSDGVSAYDRDYAAGHAGDRLNPAICGRRFCRKCLAGVQAG